MKNSQRKIKNSRNALNLSRKASARSAKRPNHADLLSLHLPLECSSASRQQFSQFPRLSVALQAACARPTSLIGDAPCPSEHALGNAFNKFYRSAFPLMRLSGRYFLRFRFFHSRYSRGKECNRSVFEECILFPASDQNAKGRFFKFPFPLSKNQGMAFAESGCFHSGLPKTQEWFLIKQAISILRSCAGPPQLVARRHLPGRKAESGALQSSLTMPPAPDRSSVCDSQRPDGRKTSKRTT